MKIKEALENKISVYRYIGHCICSGSFTNDKGNKIDYKTPKVACAKLREISSTGDIFYSDVEVFKAVEYFDYKKISGDVCFIPYFNEKLKLNFVEVLEK